MGQALKLSWCHAVIFIMCSTMCAIPYCFSEPLGP